MMQSTFDKITKIFTDPNEAVDLTLFTEIAGFILQIVKGCSSPDAAKEQIKRGGPVVFAHAISAVRSHTDLRGKAARYKAMELVKAGMLLTEDELNDLVTDAKDAPPMPIIPRGIFQFLALVAVLLFSSVAIAGDQPVGIFQIDVEQNRRLDVLEKKVDEILNTMGKPAKSAPAVTMPTVAAALAARSPAYEIRDGVRYHTSDAHLIAHGWKPEQFAGLSPDQKDWLHGAAHAMGIEPAKTVTLQQQTTATISGGYAEVCNGRRCRRFRLW